MADRQSLESLSLPCQPELDGVVCVGRFSESRMGRYCLQNLSYWFGHRPMAVSSLTFRRDDHEHKISGVSVNHEHRTRGIGRFIVGLLEDIASQQGADTMVVDSIPEAIGFYEKVGYIDLGLTPDSNLRRTECHRLVKSLVSGLVKEDAV